MSTFPVLSMREKQMLYLMASIGVYRKENVDKFKNVWYCFAAKYIWKVKNMETKEIDAIEIAKTLFYDETIVWLAGHLKTDTEALKTILDESNARLFLFVWPVFEKEIFNGFAVLNNNKPKPDDRKKDLATVAIVPLLDFTKMKEEKHRMLKDERFDRRAKKHFRELINLLIEHSDENNIAILQQIKILR